MVADFQLTSPAAKPIRKRRGGWSWGPVDGARLRVGSLGGGIQSTTLALMAEHGEIGPKPDYWLYAPVGDAQATREHIRWLASGNVISTPIIELDEPATSLRQSIQNRVEQNGKRYVSIPAFLDGKKKGQDRRQCTSEYKSARLNAKQRELMGYLPRQRIPSGSCEVWIGYSTDEVVRAGAAFETWAVNRFPLLEARMSIHDCIAWLQRNGYPVPPRSKCTFCPYRTNAEWRWLQENEPDAWADAVEIDRLIRKTPGMRAQSYLHDQRIPLDQVDLSTDLERGQEMLLVCEGVCGV
ncbi:hypothetical protein Q5698_08510 [Brucella intermedia]|uniref:hypothetical protein n=1 Tax=Brucella intermedia TaxID=94625 RepID=UPI002735A750|nr:hypothetical protein [Brucella intermedia]WLF97788.1 hypothetical protein Q5698_08510 [Brucella intermedia]